MYKTGKNKYINKKNFNEFILFYWKMKKKKKFGLPVCGTNEKKKKKSKCRKSGWATAYFFALGHDTVHCIVTQGAQGHASLGRTRPRHG